MGLAQEMDQWHCEATLMREKGTLQKTEKIVRQASHEPVEQGGRVILIRLTSEWSTAVST
jgi:hypothetical protein